MKRASVPRLAGLAEVQILLAAKSANGYVSRSYAGQVSKRPDFPAPVQVLAMGPVWVEADVQKFIDTPRKPGRSAATRYVLRTHADGKGGEFDSLEAAQAAAQEMNHSSGATVIRERRLGGHWQKMGGDGEWYLPGAGGEWITPDANPS